MSFTESIQTCFSKYADFNGRASRSEMWWWVLFVFLASAAASILGNAVSALFSLGVFLPNWRSWRGGCTTPIAADGCSWWC